MNKSSLNLPAVSTAVLYAACLFLKGSTASAQTTNQVLSVNGSTSYMSIPSTAGLQNPTAITVEAWINPTDNGTPGWFIGKSDDDTVSSARSYELTWTPGGGNNLVFNVFLGASTWGSVGAPAPAGLWVHVAGTYSSADSTLRIYTNGVQASATTFDASGINPLSGQLLRQTTLPLVFGANLSHSLDFADGLMDEVRVWNVARTQGEIAGNMGCRLSGNETNLAGYWNFDNGTANDLTGNGQNGALAGGAEIVPLTGPDVVHASCGLCLPSTATATAEVVDGFMVGATITDAGCGYTNVPNVQVVGGNGTGATAVATLADGGVATITIVSSGSGYTGIPTIVISPPPIPPVQAQGTATVVNGFVTGVTITNPGSGYGTNAPAVYFFGYPGTGAAGTATISNGVVTAVSITSAGSGYTNGPPSVLIAAPPGVPSLTLAISQVTLTMSLIPGYYYQLQKSTDGLTWNPVGGSFLATNSTMSEVLSVTNSIGLFNLTQIP